MLPFKNNHKNHEVNSLLGPKIRKVLHKIKKTLV